MRIRSFLILSFLISSLVPSLFFSVWSYRDGVTRELAEVKDRHLLIAQNLGYTLDRYQADVVAAFETVATSLLLGERLPNINQLLQQLNLQRVLIADAQTGIILLQTNHGSLRQPPVLNQAVFSELNKLVSANTTVFSGVTAGPTGENVIYLARRMDGKLAIGRLGTQYFRDLGNSISFGVKGHAAIVDQFGRVLAHPMPEWTANRKDLASVTAVQRMMRGETGIAEFYSPALKGNMIAGLTTVAGPGWGVMVPQPVSEIHDKVSENQSSVYLALGVGLSITFCLGLLLARRFAAPLEALAGAIRENARHSKLEPLTSDNRFMPVTEINDFRTSYNVMVRRVNQAGERIETLAYSDTITGLPNRDHLQAVARPILKDARKHDPGGIMVLVDIDNFKEINDLHGHDVGDEFLKACAVKLLKVTGTAANLTLIQHLEDGSREPTVARIGGDEFIIMVPGLTGKHAISLFLDQLRKELSEPTEELAFISNCSASIGCAVYPKDGTTVEELIKHADIAMYHAKNGGKNKSELYSKVSGALTPAEMRHDLVLAIESGDLTLEYQPKVCARRQTVNGAEALVRWDHPEHGRLMPSLWIPAINDSAAMGRLGEWVIERAMIDQKRLARAGHDLHVSINIGSKHFISPGFVDTLTAIQKKQGFDARKLELEVTEDALFSSEERALAVVKELSAHGFPISIDDFGKGFSNMARLAHLPVDFLKIDRSIIVGAFDDRRTRAILETTVALARSLGCRTVAEGVETLQQAEFATRLGVNCLQGYYFARSMPIANLIDWFETQADNAVHAYHQRLKEAI